MNDDWYGPSSLDNDIEVRRFNIFKMQMNERIKALKTLTFKEFSAKYLVTEADVDSWIDDTDN
jgi:hypothetical protein